MKLMEAFPSSALEIKPRSALSLFQCSSLPSKPGMKKGLCSTPVRDQAPSLVPPKLCQALPAGQAQG